MSRTKPGPKLALGAPGVPRDDQPEEIIVKVDTRWGRKIYKFHKGIVPGPMVGIPWWVAYQAKWAMCYYYRPPRQLDDGYDWRRLTMETMIQAKNQPEVKAVVEDYHSFVENLESDDTTDLEEETALVPYTPKVEVEDSGDEAPLARRGKYDAGDTANNVDIYWKDLRHRVPRGWLDETSSSETETNESMQSDLSDMTKEEEEEYDAYVTKYFKQMMDDLIENDESDTGDEYYCPVEVHPAVFRKEQEEKAAKEMALELKYERKMKARLARRIRRTMPSLPGLSKEEDNEETQEELPHLTIEDVTELLAEHAADPEPLEILKPELTEEDEPGPKVKEVKDEPKVKVRIGSAPDMPEIKSKARISGSSPDVREQKPKVRIVASAQDIRGRSGSMRRVASPERPKVIFDDIDENKVTVEDASDSETTTTTSEEEPDNPKRTEISDPEGFYTLFRDYVDGWYDQAEVKYEDQRDTIFNRSFILILYLLIHSALAAVWFKLFQTVNDFNPRELLGLSVCHKFLVWSSPFMMGINLLIVAVGILRRTWVGSRSFTTAFNVSCFYYLIIHLLLYFPLGLDFYLRGIRGQMAAKALSWADGTVDPMWNYTQSKHNCCGIDGPNTWGGNGSNLPPSCCQDYADPCLWKNAFQTGCYKKEYAIFQYYMRGFLILLGVDLGVGLISSTLFVKFRNFLKKFRAEWVDEERILPDPGKFDYLGIPRKRSDLDVRPVSFFDFTDDFELGLGPEFYSTWPDETEEEYSYNFPPSEVAGLPPTRMENVLERKRSQWRH